MQIGNARAQVSPDRPVRLWRLVLGAVVVLAGVALAVVLVLVREPDAIGNAFSIGLGVVILMTVATSTGLAIMRLPRRVRSVLVVALAWVPGLALVVAGVDGMVDWQAFSSSRGARTLGPVEARIGAGLLLVLGLGALGGWFGAVAELRGGPGAAQPEPRRVRPPARKRRRRRRR